MTLRKRVVMGAVAVGVCILVIWGFIEGRGEAANEALRETPVKAPLRIAEINGQAVVKLDAQTLKSSGIEVAALTQAPYQGQIQGYGTARDLAALTDLQYRYVNANAQWQTIRAKLNASTQALERARGLYENQQNVSLAQLQTAQATAAGDQATLAAARSQVQALAATAIQAFGPVVGKSLIDGSPLITRLIERQDILLQVTLPPGVTLTSPPQTATVRVEGSPLTTLDLLSPATQTDPRIQGLSFFYLAPASSGVLPGMNVLVSLPSGAPSTGVAIPRSAVLWWQDRAWIYRQIDASSFARTQISTDLSSKDGGFIVKDLPSDAKVVIEGAQLLLSEEFRAQIQVGAD